MPALALPPTSAYPSDPKALERDRLDGLYLELRGNYKSLMISRGIHPSRAERQGEQLRELSLRLRALAPPTIFRAKGILWFEESPKRHIFHLSGKRFTLEDDEWKTAPKNQLVLIGQNLDHDQLLAQLEACLEA